MTTKTTQTDPAAREATYMARHIVVGYPTTARGLADEIKRMSRKLAAMPKAERSTRRIMACRLEELRYRLRRLAA